MTKPNTPLPVEKRELAETFSKHGYKVSNSRYPKLSKALFDWKDRFLSTALENQKRELAEAVRGIKSTEHWDWNGDFIRKEEVLALLEKDQTK